MQPVSRILCLAMALACLGLLAQPASADPYQLQAEVPSTEFRYFLFFSAPGGFSDEGFDDNEVWGINISGTASPDNSPASA